MDFLDPVKKRAHIRRLYIGYFLVGIAILMASTIVALISYGYDLDRKTGEVIKNGLIFADTQPESAEILVNGKSNGTTDKRLTLPEGTYTVSFKRDGYRLWSKTLSLDGSSVERLTYARLFPSKLEQADSAVFTGAPGFSTQSPDRRWIMIAQASSVTNFQIFDTANPTKAPVVFDIPASLMTEPTASPQKLEPVEWSSDNRHVLVEHIYGTSHEFIMFDRQDPAASVNISKQLNIGQAKVVLRDKKPDLLYVHDEATKVLSRANIKTKEITTLLSNVTAFKPYQADIVLYARETPAKPETTEVRVWNDGKDYAVRSFNKTAVLLDLAQFDSNWYLAVVPVAEGRLQIFKNPFEAKNLKVSQNPYVALRIASPAFVSFSANTRFVAVQSENKLVVYDFETSRRAGFTLPGQVTADNKIRWMDGHRLIVNHDNKLVVVDYDGSNRQELTAMLPGTLPFFDRDYERLYTLSPSTTDATKPALIRTSLKLKQKP